MIGQSWGEKKERRRAVMEVAANQTRARRQQQESIYIHTLIGKDRRQRGITGRSRALYTVRGSSNRTATPYETERTLIIITAAISDRVLAHAVIKEQTAPDEKQQEIKHADVQRWKCYVEEHLSLHTHARTRYLFIASEGCWLRGALQTESGPEAA